ncbi:MAG: amino acid-binding protein [Candidatus Jordarchaeum sp.]|uniref:amino acid-binding protein n=1 Tax=Candidatus Jordarchaeum sp. TaxID=2823881 RepID=UPI00404B79E6
MWRKTSEYFSDHSERLAVARVLVENGLNIKNERVYCNDIEIPIKRIAQVANVDRRTVVETIKMINKNEELRTIFTLMRSAGLSLKEIARPLNLGVLEITADDPRSVGILASAATILANEGISIRQALTDDPELSPEPRLTFIADRKIPGELIPKFLEIKGVAKVSIY